jgi:hypothetical protein
MKSEGIEKHFVGEKAWTDFVRVIGSDWEKCSFKAALIGALDGREDIAKAVYSSVEDQALEWINKPVPALENVSPKDCLKSEGTVKRLKEMLMRMPR